MPNNKSNQELVADLLAQFERGDEAPNEWGTPDVSMDITAELNKLTDPDDFVHVLTILVSLLGTVINSGYTGLAASVRDDLVPKLVEGLLETSNGPSRKHLDFVLTVLHPSLSNLVAIDNARPNDVLRVPVNIRNALDNIAVFGRVMYEAGQKNQPLDAAIGYRNTVRSVLMLAMEGSGCELHPTSLQTVDRMLDTVISELNIVMGDSDGRRTEDRPDQPGLPENGG